MGVVMVTSRLRNEKYSRNPFYWHQSFVNIAPPPKKKVNIFWMVSWWGNPIMALKTVERAEPLVEQMSCTCCTSALIIIIVIVFFNQHVSNCINWAKYIKHIVKGSKKKMLKRAVPFTKDKDFSAVIHHKLQPCSHRECQMQPFSCMFHCQLSV